MWLPTKYCYLIYKISTAPNRKKKKKKNIYKYIYINIYIYIM